ncbi:hypothetical protein CRE_15745 [Caenorhabditis remanei]|uniref:Uncharacterized protein n=1 Tax=Caenorhabditis remanei TaxID=31234 RepID=E3NHE0_CAERE|nr:hypothetical protein CRE_15745 [Caenorhabditis remanei]
MNLPEKFMLSHTFRNVQHSNRNTFCGPRETINGIECCLLCHKTNESEWQCCLGSSNYPPSPLHWKVEYKIRTENGVETVGTTDGTIRDSAKITFRDDPKYYVDGNLTIECHVEFYEKCE